MKNTSYQKLHKFQIRIIPLCYSVYYETCFLMIQRSQTRGYSDTNECYYFYATGNEQLSFLRSFAIIWKHVAFCLLLSYSWVICCPGGAGGSHIKVKSLTGGNFERKPSKLSGSYFVGVAQCIVTPNGYIS